MGEWRPRPLLTASLSTGDRRVDDRISLSIDRLFICIERDSCLSLYIYMHMCTRRVDAMPIPISPFNVKTRRVEVIHHSFFFFQNKNLGSGGHAPSHLFFQQRRSDSRDHVRCLLSLSIGDRRVEAMPPSYLFV